MSVSSRYLAALGRYKWLVLAVALVGIAASAGVTRFMHPKYVADATIWVEVQTQEGQRSGPVQQSEILATTGWLDLLHSFTVMDAVIRSERLYLDYKPQDGGVFQDFRIADHFHPGEYTLRVAPDGRSYTLISAEGATIDHGVPGDSVGRAVGFRWAPAAKAMRPSREIEFTLRAPRDAAKKLNDDLQAAMPKNGNFIRLSYTGEDPQRIASVVNAVADRFVAAAAEIKASKTTEVAKILDNQVQVAQDNLRSAETALQEFNVQNATMPTGTGAPIAAGRAGTTINISTSTDGVLNHYTTTKIAQEQLEQDAAAIKRALTAGPDGGPAIDALAIIGAVQQSPEMKAALDELTRNRANLRLLKMQYTDDYSAVKKQKDDIAIIEKQTLPRIASALLSSLQLRSAQLDTALVSASGDLRSIPPRVRQQAELQRRVDVNAELYTNIQRRLAEARLASETSIPDVRVLDRA
ncbi:MAG TPA: Wzz/FepE/Etk N-terminal domain-containing protein, partial [Longimicrobiales bacterium]